MTGNVFHDDILGYLKAGADEVLEKPVKPKKIEEILKKITASVHYDFVI